MKKRKAIIVILIAAISLTGIIGGIIIGKEMLNNTKEQKDNTTDINHEKTTDAPPKHTIIVETEEDITYSDELKCEYEYYYNNIHMSVYNEAMQYENYGAGMGLMYTGFDYTKLPENQLYPGDDYKLPDGSSPTWKQYFEYAAFRSIQELHLLEDLAAKDSFAIDEAVLDEAYASIDQLKAQLSESANQAGTTQSFDSWLRETYGIGMNEDALKDIIRRQTIASEYAVVLSENFSEQSLKNNAALEAEYNKNPDLYNCVDFRIFAIYDSGSTGKNIANEMLGKITDEASFKKLAEQYATSEQKKSAYYSKNETTLMQYVEKETYKTSFGEDAVNWLFNKETKVGDKKVFEYNGTFFIFYMVKTVYRDDATIPVDVRHILYAFDDTAKDKMADEAAQKSAAEASANTIKESGDKLATFLDFCEKDSDDTGSATNGGLIDYVGRGKYVKEFEEWSLDPNRKEGDVGVIKTSYGYHVMYFVKKHPAPLWKIKLSQTLANESYKKMIDDAIASDEYNLLSSDTLNNLNKDIYEKIIKTYYPELT